MSSKFQLKNNTTIKATPTKETQRKKDTRKIAEALRAAKEKGKKDETEIESSSKKKVTFESDTGEENSDDKSIDTLNDAIDTPESTRKEIIDKPEEPTITTSPPVTSTKKIITLPNEIIVNAEMFPTSLKNIMGNYIGNYIIYFDKKSRMPFTSTDQVDYFLHSLFNSANNSDEKAPQKKNFPSIIEKIVFRPITQSSTTSKLPKKEGGAKDFVVYKKPKKTRKRKYASRTHTKKTK